MKPIVELIDDVGNKYEVFQFDGVSSKNGENLFAVFVNGIQQTPIMNRTDIRKLYSTSFTNKIRNAVNAL
jgi:hypothetical protein